MLPGSIVKWLATSPREAFWLTGVALRAALLPVRMRRRSLPELLEAMTPRRPAASRVPEPERMVRLTDRLLRRRIGPLRPNCLERSLLLYRELRRAGEPVEFCLGVRRRRPGEREERVGQGDLHGHAWLAVGGEPVYEVSPNVAAVYRETYRHPGPGAGAAAERTGQGEPAASGSAGSRGGRPGAGGADSPAAIRARLLAACARTRVNADTVRTLRSLAEGGIDWRAFQREALSHGVLPVVTRALAAHAGDMVPPPVGEAMGAWSRGQSVRNAVLFSTLADALSRLESAGLQGIPVKGPTLAIHAYGSVALRQFSDLDVLVRKADVPGLVSVLEAAGYRHVKTGETWQYVKFSAPGGVCHLDLQWGMAPDWYRFPLNFEGLRERAVRRELAGHDLWQPSSEDMLLLLCGHATKHCWSKLGWIADLNEFLGRHGGALDWEFALAEASRIGGRRQLLLGLVLARDVLGASLPEPVEAPIFRDRRLDVLATEVRRKLVAGADALTSSCGAFTSRERWAFQIRARERWGDRVAYARHLLARRSARRQIARGVLRAGRQTVTRGPAQGHAARR